MLERVSSAQRQRERLHRAGAGSRPLDRNACGAHRAGAGDRAGGARGAARRAAVPLAAARSARRLGSRSRDLHAGGRGDRQGGREHSLVRRAGVGLLDVGGVCRARGGAGDFRAGARSDGLGSGAGAESQGRSGRGRLSRVRHLELCERHQACGLARLPLSAVRGGRHAASGPDGKPAERTMLIPKAQRRGRRHLARDRPQGHRQRQVCDRRSVRSRRIHIHARNPPPTAARPARSTA